MGGYRQPYSGVNRGGESFQTPLPDAQDGMTFNEKRLDSSRTTVHCVDIFGNRNTDLGQGMANHPLNADNAPRMPENRPQTNGSTYPNVVSIKARDTNIKGGGQMYA